MEGLKKELIIMNFSGVYKEESFWKEESVQWIEAGDISGTNCYCDDEAFKELQKRMGDFSVEGIHFLDSGNYHYMTRLWIEKIKEPFQLLVLDNHTDMQLPAFGGILSCGGWIARSLETLPYLKKVFLIGPGQEDWHEVAPSFQEKTSFLGRDMLWKAYREGEESLIQQYIKKIDSSLPLYLSIDKDILCEEEACTGWSQGDMTERELFDFLEKLFACLREKNIPLLGVDICGEGEREDWKGLTLNDKGNSRILEFFGLNFWKKGVLNEK